MSEGNLTDVNRPLELRDVNTMSIDELRAELSQTRQLASVFAGKGLKEGREKETLRRELDEAKEEIKRRDTTIEATRKLLRDEMEDNKLLRELEVIDRALDEEYTPGDSVSLELMRRSVLAKLEERRANP